ncbi:Aldehyde/histidinol dehydrogenase [Mycena galopus ATCC 62051]|nr:Aldehyde/histidinol dehydrogenase [Mycena galopus ATCC 62051]
MPAGDANAALPRPGEALCPRALIPENLDAIGTAIVASPPWSNRKHHANSTQGDVLRKLHVVESACAIPTTLMGEKLEVNKDMDTETRKVLLGVCASIASFHPLSQVLSGSSPHLYDCPYVKRRMIHLWTILLVLVTGNTILIKPSERDPGATMIIAERPRRPRPFRFFPAPTSASYPPPRPPSNTTRYLIYHSRPPPRRTKRLPRHSPHRQRPLHAPPRPSASSAGITRGGTSTLCEDTKHGKRVQRNIGAKNHAVVRPDAKRDQALNPLLWLRAARRGRAVFFDKAQPFIPELVARAGKLKVNQGLISTPQPPLTPSTQRPRNLPRHAEEIFGPVLGVRDVPTFDAAIALLNANPFGNGAAVFTRSGAVARRLEMRVEAGQIRVNVPIPVPLLMFSWTGNKASHLP